MFESLAGVGLSILGGVGVAAAVTVVGVSQVAGVNSVADLEKAGGNTANVNGVGTSVYGN